MLLDSSVDIAVFNDKVGIMFLAGISLSSVSVDAELFNDVYIVFLMRIYFVNEFVDVMGLVSYIVSEDLDLHLSHTVWELFNSGLSAVLKLGLSAYVCLVFRQ